MENINLETLNSELIELFGWEVEVAEQLDSYGEPSQYLKLYNLVRPGRPDCKRAYVGPMPIDIPEFAIKSAGWLCRDFFEMGYKQGRRDEGRSRRKKRRVKT